MDGEKEARPVSSLLLILAFGAGSYLFYDGLTRSPARTPNRGRLRWLEEWLLRAGLREVTPRDFALFSLAAGLGSGLFVQLWLDWPAVSGGAAVAGALVPTLY